MERNLWKNFYASPVFIVYPVILGLVCPILILVIISFTHPEVKIAINEIGAPLLLLVFMPASIVSAYLLLTFAWLLYRVIVFRRHSNDTVRSFVIAICSMIGFGLMLVGSMTGLMAVAEAPLGFMFFFVDGALGFLTAAVTATIYFAGRDLPDPKYLAICEAEASGRLETA